MVQHLSCAFSKLRVSAWLVLLVSCASNEVHEPVGISHFPAHCAITGGMERIRCVVDTHKTIIYAVYKRHRSMSYRLAGMMTFRLHIAKEGVVRTVDVVQNTTANAGFAEELADNLRAMNFGGLKQERIILYPMRF